MQSQLGLQIEQEFSTMKSTIRFSPIRWPDDVKSRTEPNDTEMALRSISSFWMVNFPLLKQTREFMMLAYEGYYLLRNLFRCMIQHSILSIIRINFLTCNFAKSHNLLLWQRDFVDALQMVSPK